MTHLFRLLLPICLISTISTAYACPTLSGKYHCKFETTGPQDLEVSQSEAEGHTIFIIGGNEAIADGVVHEMIDDEELKDGVYRAICLNDTLEIWLKANLTFATGYLETTMSLFFDASGNLINESRGEMSVDGRIHNLDNRGVCVPR